MKKEFLPLQIFLISVLSYFSISLQSQTKLIPEIQYLSPVPESKYVTQQSNIIISYKNEINRTSVTNSKFIIAGSLSGFHFFDIIFTNERSTVILQPKIQFIRGEIVSINILNGLVSQKGEVLPPFNFSFNITAKEKYDYSPRIPYSNEYSEKNNISPNISGSFFQTDSLPMDFPKITILRKYDTAPGYIFLSNFSFGPFSNPTYLMVLDNSGYPVLYKKMKNSCADFKVQNNNTFTYYDYTSAKFYATNTSLIVTDSFYCGNGYSTDVHELLLLPDNHGYLMSYDSQTVDMSKIVAGGNPNAVVSGLIIQEIDENKNVIFQWRSWDHFQITDATHENLLGNNIDYVHGNAIDLDFDGNVLISSRHLDEITKINRQTGDIIWRLGGKNNQFNFVNDPLKFSHQHAIRKLSNGNYLLFDNGNYHEPPFSRACEYRLDEANKTATLVWQFRNSPDVYGGAMGDAQRLPNGNTLIGWGAANPSVTEVRPNGVKIFELTLPNGIFSYRAFRQTWDGAPPEVLPQKYLLYQNFPNPFNPSTTFKFDLPENSYVTLKIYDLVGREVNTLINENQTAGRYLIDFNASNLASGVYFYKLTANGFTEAKKMILVK